MRALSLALVLSMVLAAAAPARATIMVPLDTKALVTRADRVLLGTVESSTSSWSSDHQAIYTDVVVRVARVYKGALTPGATVTVRREGGSVDGIGMRVYGAASFQPGEEVLLFLETRGAAVSTTATAAAAAPAWTVGMTQGKMHVSTDASGQKLVGRDLSSVAFTGDAHARARAQASAAPRPLADLEREILGYVRGAQ